MKLTRIQAILIIIFLHLLIGATVAIFISGSTPQEERYKEARKLFSQLNDSVKEGSVIILGDQFLPISEVAAGATIFPITSDTIDGLAERINDYPSLERVGVIVLMIGTNDAALPKEPNLINLSNKLPASKRVFWFAIPPIDSRIEKIITNERIKELNQKIKDVCAMRNNCYFVDLTDQFADGNGDLKPEYHEVKDGIHLNKEGHRVLVRELNRLLASKPTS